jgi:hypothetical protein
MSEPQLIEDLRFLSPPSLAWVWAVAAVAVLALLAWVGWRLAQRRRQSAESIRPIAAPAWESALADLERLAALLHPDRSREYGIEATGVLRRFLEAHYGLRAPTLATEEFLATAARSNALPAAAREKLERFLANCDLIKFGRYLATTDELRALHAAAVEVVLASRSPVGRDAAAGGGD